MDDKLIEAAARAAHEVNATYCRVVMGDFSQPTWAEAPEWQRVSARSGVQAIVDDPTTTPENSHRGWLAHKVQDGWKHGPEKDEVAKTHPCMVAYEQLPAGQRAKDGLFGIVVRAVLGL